MIDLYLSLVLSCGFMLLSCSSPQNNKDKPAKIIETAISVEKSAEVSNYYDFEYPTQTYVLHKKLVEISGLTYNSNKNLFLTINDEEGVIYYLDPNTFEIVSENKFARSGDYEAIAILDEKIVVSKNTGTLYFNNISSNDTKIYNTELNARNNVEGLCFDMKSNALLIACKEQPLGVGNKKDKKCVYRFDLDTKELDKTPFLTIYDNQLLSFLESMELDESKSKLKKMKRKVKNFAPSGIAIHPVTGDYYLTSGRGSLLLIIGENKQIKDIIFLNSKSNPQPEGITFDKDNNLYISTEGKGFNGKVFKFAYSI